MILWFLSWWLSLCQVSKKRAAELMLEELRKLPALPPTTMVRIKRKPTTKKKSRNLIKVGQEASIPPHPIFLYATLTTEWLIFCWFFYLLLYFFPCIDYTLSKRQLCYLKSQIQQWWLVMEITVNYQQTCMHDDCGMPDISYLACWVSIILIKCKLYWSIVLFTNFSLNYCVSHPFIFPYHLLGNTGCLSHLAKVCCIC